MDEYSAKLVAIFQNVNEWLKFAETKNAVLLAFAGAGITATISRLATASKIPTFLQVGLLVITSLLCICALICSISFLPRINLERVLWAQTRPTRNLKHPIKNTDNFYFFGDLKKYNSTQLLDALNQYYFENKLTKPYKKEYEDLASQISINAQIAFLKLKLFTYALYSLIVAIIAILFFILLA
jgi:hypothetical protein